MTQRLEWTRQIFISTGSLPDFNPCTLRALRGPVPSSPALNPSRTASPRHSLPNCLGWALVFGGGKQKQRRPRLVSRPRPPRGLSKRKAAAKNAKLLIRDDAHGTCRMRMECMRRAGHDIADIARRITTSVRLASDQWGKWPESPGWERMRPYGQPSGIRLWFFSVFLRVSAPPRQIARLRSRQHVPGLTAVK